MKGSMVIKVVNPSGDKKMSKQVSVTPVSMIPKKRNKDCSQHKLEVK